VAHLVQAWAVDILELVMEVDMEAVSDTVLDLDMVLDPGMVARTVSDMVLDLDTVLDPGMAVQRDMQEAVIAVMQVVGVVLAEVMLVEVLVVATVSTPHRLCHMLALAETTPKRRLTGMWVAVLGNSV